MAAQCLVILIRSLFATVVLIFYLFQFLLTSYGFVMFFCLDAKEPKDQGRHESSAIRPCLASPGVAACFFTFGLWRDTLVSVAIIFWLLLLTLFLLALNFRFRSACKQFYYLNFFFFFTTFSKSLFTLQSSLFEVSGLRSSMPRVSDS